MVALDDDEDINLQEGGQTTARGASEISGSLSDTWARGSRFSAILVPKFRFFRRRLTPSLLRATDIGRGRDQAIKIEKHGILVC